MIEDIWNRMKEDPMAEEHSFKKIGLPSPDAGSISKCRELCEQNLCKAYNVTWGCPPGVGGEEECLNIIGSFSKAAILIRKFSGIDLKDKELIDKLGTDHQEVCRRFGNMLRQHGYRVMPLADGGCRYCKECSYPDDKCRFPEQRVSSISSYGILMEEYMNSQNIDFSFEKDGMTLYGLIMYDEP